VQTTVVLHVNAASPQVERSERLSTRPWGERINILDSLPTCGRDFLLHLLFLRTPSLLSHSVLCLLARVD